MTTIDLNCDLGEGFGAWEMGNDAAMIDLATSVNVACGFHAGDPDIMRHTVELAKARGELIERKAVKRFLAERGRMERDSWLAWASAVSARLAASLGVDHGKLFALIEDEVRAQLRYLAEKPLDLPGAEAQRQAPKL